MMANKQIIDAHIIRRVDLGILAEFELTGKQEKYSNYIWSLTNTYLPHLNAGFTVIQSVLKFNHLKF